MTSLPTTTTTPEGDVSVANGLKSEGIGNLTPVKWHEAPVVLQVLHLSPPPWPWRRSELSMATVPGAKRAS